MALGFTVDIIANAGSAARTLGTELGKNPEDRDSDAISSAASDLVQDFGFAPFAGLHGTRDVAERYADKPMYAIRQLSDQLQNAPIIQPAPLSQENAEIAPFTQNAAPETGAVQISANNFVEKPSSQKIDDLQAAVGDLRNVLRGKLPIQEQQTVNAPFDKTDQIIRNVFPTEARSIAGTSPSQHSNLEDLNITKRPQLNAVQTTTKQTNLAPHTRIAQDTTEVATGERKLTSPIRDLRAAGLKDAHHVIQDAAVRDLPGYDSNDAPGVQLPGPATTKGTRHNTATSVQRRVGGGTYAAERRIGYMALRRAGFPRQDVKRIIEEADAYFWKIGVLPSTPTRIPANRR